MNIPGLLVRRQTRANIYALCLILGAGIFLAVWLNMATVEGHGISSDKKMHFFVGQIIAVSIFYLTYMAIVARIFLVGKNGGSFTTIFLWFPTILAVAMVAAIIITLFLAAGKEILDFSGIGTPDMKDLRYTIEGGISIVIPIALVMALTPVFIPVNMLMQLPKLRQTNSYKKKEHIRQIKKLEKLSFIDSHLQLANRRCFDIFYERAWMGARRDRQSLAMILVEVDGYDAYKKYYGKEKSKECLEKIASAIDSFANRSKDLVARFDENQFVVLLIDIDENNVLRLSDEMRLRVEGLNIKNGGCGKFRSVTISMGVSMTIPDNNNDSQRLLQTAHFGLSEARLSGGNTYHFYG